MARGYHVVSGGTDNHLILIDLTNKNVPGKVAAKALDKAGDRAQLQLGPLRHPQAVRPVGDPAGDAVGLEPRDGRRRDEADRRLDGPGDRATPTDDVAEKVLGEVREVTRKFPAPGISA